MKSKHMRRVLRNGPSKGSPGDLVVAVWLIRNGYAHGSVQEDHTQVTEVPKNIVWKGVSDKGHDYLTRSVLKERVVFPLIVTVAGGLILTFVGGLFG